MKRRRYRFKLLALFLFLLFALLAVCSVWSVRNYGSRWFSYAGNPRLNVLKETVTEGDIKDRNSIILATTHDGKRHFADDPATRAAMLHVLGDRDGYVANGVESFHAGYLYGYHSSLRDSLHRLTSGSEKRGNDLTLTVSAPLSAMIVSSFESHPLSSGKNGAAVVVNYKTSELLAMISLPSVDPDAQTDHLPDSVWWNRATQGLYPPGSTFKIVTSYAAMDNWADALTRSIDCTGSLFVTDAFSVRDFAGSVHGRLTLKQAFLKSCNTTYASVALSLGDDALRKAAENFGFNKNFLFRDLVVYNSEYPSGRQSAPELAASGYGQSSLLASPMHMCLISAAVANGGVMPEPYVLKSVVSASGGSVPLSAPSNVLTVCTPDQADRLSSLMKAVVQEGGSGSSASVSGLDIRGKTGTSESGLSEYRTNYAWFTGFCADDDLPYALCILVEDIPDGETGGTVSAPIAKDIFIWLREHRDQV